MLLPPLPPAPRSYPPSLEQRVTARGMLLVFGSYLLAANGILLTVVGISWMLRTFIFIGLLALLVGGILGVVRMRRDRRVARLLRDGEWSVGRIARVDADSRRRTICYEFSLNGAAVPGWISEPLPGSDEFVAGAPAAVLYDPAAPRENLLLSRDTVEIMRETWNLNPPGFPS